MQVPERWLRSMCNPSVSTADLAQLLTMSGLEVEDCAPVAPGFSGVVVAEVLAVEKHPNADKLSVCRVSVNGESLQIVCGAPNVRAGMKAPLARVGAVLAGKDGKAIPIGIAKMRGVESQGMLCSARELGLSEDHSGLLEFPAQARTGQDVREALDLNDQVFTLKLTPNRADCLSVLGVAREVAALTGAKLAAPPCDPVPARNAARHPVRISHPDGCGRFAGRVIRNVNAAAPTPDWMKQRLARAGQRSISALVDITNYVMLELGRPLHVYDLDKLHGPIDVRWGKRGERVRLLNEQTVEVDESVLCITDDSGVIGLAGIMGGDSTKAETATRNILLESAFFHPEAIAGRARRFNFTSDASHRFERGVDFDNNAIGIERATQLVLELCGGEPGPTEDLVARLPERPTVRMRVARTRKVIGVDIPVEDMARILERLSLPARREGQGSDETFVVKPPSYRFDITIEEDLIEEIARVYGFDRIPANPPRAAAVMHAQPETRRSLHGIREWLAARDYQEVVNFSFVEPQWEEDFAGEKTPIRLLNPIASPLSVMRSSLLGGLVANLRYNIARKLPRVRVFEIGRAFVRDPDAPDGPLAVAGLHQPIRIAIAAYGPAIDEQWGTSARDVDFFDVKADIETLCLPRQPRFERATHPAFHPGRSARIVIGGQPAGWIGELHPMWLQKYELPRPAVLAELDVRPLQELPVVRAQVPSRFPPVVRDMAFVVDSKVPASELFATLAQDGAPLVKEVRLFDLYVGEKLPRGKKSVAFRVVMQDTERTLKDAEADETCRRMADGLNRRYAAELRK